MKNLKKLQKEASLLISRARLKEALNLISEHQHLFEYDESTTIINLQGQFKHLHNLDMAGATSIEHLRIERNKLIQATLNLLKVKDIKTPAIRENYPKVSIPQGISFKQIKDILKRLKDSEGKISYLEALESISELF